MGSGSKKKQVCDMGNYIATDKEREANSWCIRNDIRIAPKPKSLSSWYLTVTINGKESISPEAYEKIEIWKMLFKYSVYYYNKYHGIPLAQAKEKEKATVDKKEKSNELTLF